MPWALLSASYIHYRQKRPDLVRLGEIINKAQYDSSTVAKGWEVVRSIPTKSRQTSTGLAGFIALLTQFPKMIEEPENFVGMKLNTRAFLCIVVSKGTVFFATKISLGLSVSD